MGVPDFVKFIARSSPGALCRLPKSGPGLPLVFDFILVDATNAAQTLGFEALLALLSPDQILAKSAVIFAIDSQRDRSGTVRSMRFATSVRVGDLDVEVQQFSTKLAEMYRALHKRPSAGVTNTATTASPYILTSGRGVAGEADYKLLDLQRSLITATVASGATVLPTFLFISEDSDVLCGALCGPAPQQVSIATRLQDLLYEPSILRLDRVLAFVATCTDAFYAENAREAAAVVAAKAKAAAERHAAKANKAMLQKASEVSAQDASPAENEEKELATAEAGDDEVELSVTDTAQPAAPVDDVVRRRRQDGPMVATGVRIQLDDSSEEDEEKTASNHSGTASTVPAGAGAAVVNATITPTATPLVQASGATKEVTLATATLSAAPTEGEMTVSSIAFTSAVDMVFLFMMVMGNGANVPPLVRGATKVDSSACWQAYCKQKYKILAATEAETGRVLLTVSASTHSTMKGTYVLNCQFLLSILESLHYSDVESRIASEEEKNSALAYLSTAVFATLRYVVGCNISRAPALQHTFLDTRALSEKTTVEPTFSALMWVLGQEAMRSFTFPLLGVAKRDLLATAAGGAAGGKWSSAVSANAATASPTHTGSPSSIVGELNVGDHLVPVAAASAWAVRGARMGAVSLAALVQSFAEGGTGASTKVGARSTAMPSVSDLLKLCLQKVSPASLAKANVLVYLVTIWEYALGLGVRRIAALTKTAAQVARAEGGEDAFTAVQTVTSGNGSIRTKETNGAGGNALSARAKVEAGHYVYSFELRRMAPVMQTTNNAKRPATQTGASDPATGKPYSDKPASPSAAELAIRAALGFSYDYSAAQAAPSNLVNLPRSAMDDDDKAELDRLKKVAKKERALVASVAAEAGTQQHQRKKMNGEGGAERAERRRKASVGKGAAHPLPETEGEAPKTARRPGKRERQRLQKAQKRSEEDQ